MVSGEGLLPIERGDRKADEPYSHKLLFASEISVRLGVFINHAGDTVERLLLLSISVSSDEFGGIFICRTSSFVLYEMLMVLMSSSGPARDKFHKWELRRMNRAVLSFPMFENAATTMTCKTSI